MCAACIGSRERHFDGGRRYWRCCWGGERLSYLFPNLFGCLNARDLECTADFRMVRYVQASKEGSQGARAWPDSGRRGPWWSGRRVVWLRGQAAASSCRREMLPCRVHVERWLTWDLIFLPAGHLSPPWPSSGLTSSKLQKQTTTVWLRSVSECVQ